MRSQNNQNGISTGPNKSCVGVASWLVVITIEQEYLSQIVLQVNILKLTDNLYQSAHCTHPPHRIDIVSNVYRYTTFKIDIL